MNNRFANFAGFYGELPKIADCLAERVEFEPSGDFVNSHQSIKVVTAAKARLTQTLAARKSMALQ